MEQSPSATQPPLVHHLRFSLAGAVCLLRSNSPHLADTIALHTIPANGDIDCTLTVTVTARRTPSPGTPHFRGMAHIVVASFGEANLFLFDLKRHCITAQVSTTLAEHTEFWQRTFLPIAAGVLGATIGILPVHSACLSRNGNGILIAGDSGVGKSTLAVALAQRQFDYISDDWTYCTGKTGILKAHGTGAPVKLLPNTINLFPLLREFTTHVTMNGEMAYEVQADTVFGAHIQKQCTPRALLFYKRDNTAASRITRLSQAESRSYLEANVERLPDVLSQAAATRNRLMDTVAALPCWQITCTGTPQANAASVEAFYQQQEQRWIQ